MQREYTERRYVASLHRPASIQLPPACGTTVRSSYALDDLRRNLPH